MRLGLDVSALQPEFKSHALRGIGRYVRELCNAFERCGSLTEEGVIDLTPDIQLRKFDYRLFSLPSLVDQLIRIAPYGRQTIRQQLAYPWQLARKTSHLDVVHFPAHMDAPSWSAKPTIITVLDLIPLICRDLYDTPGDSWRFRLARFLELSAIRRAGLIIAISECTAQDVTRLLGIPRERIVVTPLGVDERFFSAADIERDQANCHRFKLAPKRPIVLYVGGIDPRKNYQNLVAAFSQLSTRLRDRGQPAPYLIMVGAIETDREYPKLRALLKSTGTIDDTILTGGISDTELLALLHRATVFCFPSLYEGFGLPVLEAMAAGLPVVSSNRSSMPEVIADAGLLADPERPAELAEKLELVITTPTLQRELSARGQARARLFSWARTAEATLNAYELYRTRFLTGGPARLLSDPQCGAVTCAR